MFYSLCFSWSMLLVKREIVCQFVASKMAAEPAAAMYG
jgi:hypothetical protein